MKINSIFLSKKGFSLVEMLVYVAVLTINLIFVTNTLFSFTSSYRTLGALRAADHAGIDAMEHLTRSVRAATSISLGDSVFGATPGALTLVATDNGISTTTKYYIKNGTLTEDINGTYFGPLTASNVTVTNLTFYNLATSSSNAVKIDLTVEGRSGVATKTKTFHSTIVLKGQ